MKRFLAVMLLLVAVQMPVVVQAAGPDDDYVAIYTMIQEGDALNEKGQSSAALAKYAEAQNALKRFKTAYPEMYGKVVSYRLSYLANKITLLTPQSAPAVPATNAAPHIATNVPPPAPVEPPITPSVAPASTVAPPSAELENQVKGLQEQVRRMEADHALLEAKLKEALAARPAELDPQELAKAREQVTTLQKENELLKANVESSKSSPSTTAASAAILEKSRQELAEANRKLAALTEANASLAQEKNSLQMQMKKLSAPDTAAAALRDENAILKKQIAELKTKPTPAAPDEALQRKLQESQAQLAALQSDKEILRMEKMVLEAKVKQMVANTNAAAPVAIANAAPAPAPEILDSVTASKLAQLEAQRDELQKSLDAALRDVKGRRKGKETAARLDEMTRQLAALRTRIQVFEANPIPYTAEEAALFSKPGTTLMAAAHSSARKIKEPPAAAQVLLAQGQRYFVAREYDKAEEKYLEALKVDPKNSVMLSDLASIQLQENHLADSEKNIKAALAIQPDDAFSQMVLGQLKFEQKNYDEAFDALSRAAQMNPQNARIQNLLGLTLSEKGFRGPAETAFRKAIQLDPGFADAHINLAVVYATQQPPLLELARWHYQKALGAGHAASPTLEKMLDPTATAKK